MKLRDALLQFVATPDRAWLTLLAGSLLIARECVAPGRIVPGMIGGIMLLTAIWYVPPAIPGLLAAVVLLILQARYAAWYLPSVAAAAAAVMAARQAGTGWPAALASVPLVAILAVLIRVGVLAHKRKVSPDPIP